MSPNEKERAVWELSAKINMRGFHVDRQFAEAARRIARVAASKIDAELAELTGGAVTGINQVARLLVWLRQEGCSLQKLDRKAVARQIDKEDLPPVTRRVLELRAGGAQAAVKKIDSLLARAGDDDRVRGTFRYCGAATGRWSGEGFQPQNLKRPTVADLDAAIAAISSGDLERVKTLSARPLAVVGDCSRSMIVAMHKHVLMGGDFSAIEPRVLSWVVDERWKCDSFRRLTRPETPRDEVYCETACRISGRPSGSLSTSSPERAIGKVATLAFGYQGGLNAWRKFQPDDKRTDAEVEQLKNEWRAAHPATVKLWRRLDRAAVLAVRECGEIVRCGHIDLKCVGMFLQLKLPSGRKLSYPQPRLIEDKRGRLRVLFSDNAAGKFVDCRFGLGAYGGLFTENIVQAIARDLLAEAMLRIEAAGYPIVIHVHDEIVAEVPEGFGSLEEFTRLMTRKPAWAPDLPIAASGWTGPRYCK